MIPREGGNRFSGSFAGAYRPGKWQGNNLSDRLKAGHADFVPAVLGLTAGNATDRIEDFTGGEGGPILRDKLLFSISGRYYSGNNFIPQAFTNDSSPGTDDQFIERMLAR